MRLYMVRWITLCVAVLSLILVQGCRQDSSEEDPALEPDAPVEHGGWRAPELGQFREAYEWGSNQGSSDITALWFACASGQSGLGLRLAQEAPNTRLCSEGALILTPLAVTAIVAQLRAAGLPEAEVLDIFRDEHEQGTVAASVFSALQLAPDHKKLQALLTNELTVFLLFEGSIWDLDFRHEGQITQGELVIEPFDSRTTYHGEERSLIVEVRFKVGELNPQEEFWCAITQDPGGRRFTFRVHPDGFGPEEFF